MDESEKPRMNSVLSALASPARLKMLRELSRRELSYSELMEAAGMDRERDAGKFSYHLRKLITAGLVEADKRSRRYRVTSQGSLVLEYLERMERELGASSMLIVRRSEHLMEPFDRRKIAEALVREAKLTPKLAGEVALLAEEKLSSLKIKYLTAPLIRELVNSILLDMGLEKYRHRLTRVGMPVYDVSKLLRRVAEKRDYRVFLEEAAGAVAEEYFLLNVLPRPVAEAHLSGQIDLYPMKRWLTSVYGGGYRVSSKEDAGAILQEVLRIGVELYLEVGSIEALREVLSPLMKSLPADRVLSIGFHGAEEALKALERVPEVSGRVRVMSRLGDSPKRLTQLDERLRRIGVEPYYTVGGTLLSDGYSLESGKNPLKIHAVASVNVPAAALESDRNVEEALKKVRERAARAAGALSHALHLFRTLYREEGVASIVSVCGLFEAVKFLSGSSPAVSEDSERILLRILEAVREGAGKGSEGGEVRVAAKCPKPAAQRMMKADIYRFGLEEVGRVAGRRGGGYSYLAIPPRERFRSLEDRLEIEVRVASLMNGGHLMVLPKARRTQAFEILATMVEELEKANPRTLIGFE